MGIEKKTYSFRLDEGLVERLRSYAKEENRNLSNMIETILLQYLSNRDSQDKKWPSAGRQAVIFMLFFSLPVPQLAALPVRSRTHRPECIRR